MFYYYLKVYWSSAILTRNYPNSFIYSKLTPNNCVKIHSFIQIKIYSDPIMIINKRTLI